MGSARSVLRQLTRKEIELPRATAAAIEADLLPDGETITLWIRKVRTAEVYAATGVPPSLLSATKAGEGDAAMSRLLDDPDGTRDLLRYQDDLVRAVLVAGILDPQPDAQNDAAPTIEDLGDDVDHVYHEINVFSSLPFVALEVAHQERFPGERVAPGAVEDGAPLRDDAERPPVGNDRGVDPESRVLPGGRPGAEAGAGGNAAAAASSQPAPQLEVEVETTPN